MDWYEKNVEAEIRPLVKLLRDNGINTVSSCGHGMYVQCSLLEGMDILDIHELMAANGYDNFSIVSKTFKNDHEHGGHVTIWLGSEGVVPPGKE